MKKILIIEDDLNSRNIFVEGLEAEGFSTLSAANGNSGVTKAKEDLPDLVLCDIVMPEFNGHEVLTALRNYPPTATIPFIFLTGKANKTEVRQGMELGADDYVTKPSTIEELIRAINTQFQKRKKLEQLLIEKLKSSLGDLSNKTQNLAIKTQIFPICPQLKEVFDFIEANYHLAIGLNEVAQAIGYSPAYLTDLVRRQTGHTVNNWIIKRRMVAACVLLVETNNSIELIAETVGYKHCGHFFRQFRQHYGTTPLAWRKAQQSNLSLGRCTIAG